MPDGSKHYHKPSNYDFLCDEFKSFIDTYRRVTESIPFKPYFKSMEYAACSFLLKLQKMGINSFELITEKDILDLFSTDEKISKSYDFKYNVEVAFKMCAPFYSNSLFSNIILYLPNLPKIKKNIQYLTKSEIEKIKFVLDNDPSVSLQNKAICLLALYTGLRNCDIATLSFDKIDWENDLICITQNKTGIPLTLPLRAVVGNALFDYITKERPQSPERFIFLTVNAPFRRLHTTNLNAICISIMNKAGIRNKPNDRRGFHLFRHYVATSLLGNGVEQPIISSTLGHQSPSSLNSYLNADLIHLKDCSLSINDFPFREEVFQS
jgi:integrase